jgi:hypothetical protein
MATARQHNPTVQSAMESHSNMYPIQVEVEYRLVSRGLTIKTGRGRTLRISTTHVLFESQDRLPAGVPIELSIAWPALLNNEVGLQLCVMGRTAPTRENCTAVIVERHAFRTRSLRHKSFKEESEAVPVSQTRI